MNRYVIAGLVTDAEQGNLVGALPASRHEVADALSAVAMEPTIKRVSRANGAERAEFLSGGRIVFFRSTDAIRGYTLDVLAIDEVMLHLPRVREDVAPCLSPNGELILL